MFLLFVLAADDSTCLLVVCCSLTTLFVSLLIKVILAFGNYMNSSKRGAAYGFRLQSLDLVRNHKTSTLNKSHL